jgi:hypothetical protein
MNWLVDSHDVALTFDQLALVYKALQAAKVLAAQQGQDELLDDTIAIVDQALETFVRCRSDAA